MLSRTRRSARPPERRQRATRLRCTSPACSATSPPPVSTSRAPVSSMPSRRALAVGPADRPSAQGVPLPPCVEDLLRVAGDPTLELGQERSKHGFNADLGLRRHERERRGGFGELRRELARVHVQADAERGPTLPQATLDQDAGELALADPDVVRPLDGAARRREALYCVADRHRGRERKHSLLFPQVAQDHATSARRCAGGAVHARPWRPRPAVCSSAVTSVPWGAPASASAFARALVESSTRSCSARRAQWCHRGLSRTSESTCRPRVAAASPRLIATASIR